MTDDSIRLAQPNVGDDEIAALTRVIRSGMLSGGPEVAALESEFSDFVGGRPCVAVNSGTAALHLGLLAGGIGPGDEVIVPSFTFAATANAVALTGAQPVFADIDSESYCLSISSASKLLSDKTAAIMPVHLYGHPADMSLVSAFAEQHGILVFEDAAQAHLAQFAMQPVGTFGTAAAFSFYPTKNMTTGEGGMVACANEEIADRVRLLRNQGMRMRYQNEIVGFNARLSDLHAAIGRVQLGKLPAWTARRREIAERLSLGLRGVRTPSTQRTATHSFHQYTVRVDPSTRPDLQAHLLQLGIQSDIYYPIPVHRLKPFAGSARLPESDLAAAEVLSLPVHPGLSDSDVERIIVGVNSFRSSGEL